MVNIVKFNQAHTQTLFITPNLVPFIAYWGFKDTFGTLEIYNLEKDLHVIP